MAPGDITEQRNKISMKRLNHKLLIISPLLPPKIVKSEPHEKGEGLPSHELSMALRHLIHHGGCISCPSLSPGWGGGGRESPIPDL